MRGREPLWFGACGVGILRPPIRPAWRVGALRIAALSAWPASRCRMESFRRLTFRVDRFDAARRTWAAALLALLAASSGCTQRRMTIVSNPPGATAYIDGVEIGKTPVSHDFIYYGTREIRLVRDGYKTLTVLQPMSTPWYQVPPLDFFSDNLAFGEIRDERVYRYDLEAAVQEPFDAIVGRGEALRRGSVVPATATVPQELPAITYPPPIAAPPSQANSAAVAPSTSFPAPPFVDLGGGLPPVPGDELIPPGRAPGKPRRSWPTPN